MREEFPAVDLHSSEVNWAFDGGIDVDFLALGEGIHEELQSPGRGRRLLGRCSMSLARKLRNRPTTGSSVLRFRPVERHARPRLERRFGP